MTSSMYFHWVFTACMVGLPLPIVLWICQSHLEKIKEPTRSVVRSKIRPAMTRLAIVSGHLALGFFLWFSLDFEAIQGGRRQSLFFWEIIGFHFLWWLFAMPVFRRLYKSMEESGTVSNQNLGTVRVASLRPREVGQNLPRLLRILPWLLFAAGLWLLVEELRSSVIFTPRSIWLSLTFAFSGLLFLIGYSFWIHREVMEPQPLFGTGPNAQEYEREAESLRKFRIRMIFISETLGSALFIVLAIFNLEMARGQVARGLLGIEIKIAEGDLGILGAIGGSLIGCLGAAFGMLASRRALRLQMLRAELEKEGTQLSV